MWFRTFLKKSKGIIFFSEKVLIFGLGVIAATKKKSPRLDFFLWILHGISSRLALFSCNFDHFWRSYDFSKVTNIRKKRGKSELFVLYLAVTKKLFEGNEYHHDISRAISSRLVVFFHFFEGPSTKKKILWGKNENIPKIYPQKSQYVLCLEPTYGLTPFFFEFISSPMDRALAESSENALLL